MVNPFPFLSGQTRVSGMVFWGCLLRWLSSLHDRSLSLSTRLGDRQLLI
ncbi:hypothetical protein SynROS8604_02498 [Synechococcus sp. ROS8604]|nr:hypothetical protein SynROS8604_02498 [Synechococcus sp. ROS8604]